MQCEDRDMTKIAPEQEKDAVDVVTNTMLSLGFLDDISKVIFSPNRHRISVGEFYDKWLQATGAPELKVPFNLGVFVAYLYCGLLVTKENWYDLLPDTELSNLDPDWGLVGVTCTAPKQPRVTLPHFIRRLRNALGHANLSFSVPKDIKYLEDIHTRVEHMHKRVALTFRDENPRDPSDTFQATLTLIQLEKLIKKFHSIVHRTVRVKYGTQ